jgi:hypothetical protein
MKKTSSPSDRLKKLNPELTRFIENMGMYFESYGIPRIGGRILGLLIAPELLAQNASRPRSKRCASISTNIRVLRRVDLQKRLHFMTAPRISSSSSTENRACSMTKRLTTGIDAMLTMMGL